MWLLKIKRRTTYTVTIQWNASSYFIESTALIEVKDQDQNVDLTSKDEIEILVNSTSDVYGLSVTLKESEINIGDFQGVISFWHSSTNEGHDILQVLEGDLVTAIYVDPFNSNGFEEIIKSINTITSSSITSKTLNNGISGFEGHLLLLTLPIILIARKPRIKSYRFSFSKKLNLGSPF